MINVHSLNLKDDTTTSVQSETVPRSRGLSSPATTQRQRPHLHRWYLDPTAFPGKPPALLLAGKESCPGGTSHSRVSTVAVLVRSVFYKFVLVDRQLHFRNVLFVNHMGRSASTFRRTPWRYQTMMESGGMGILSDQGWNRRRDGGGILGR